MNISSLFIRRPVMTTLIMIWLIFMSIFAYRAIPINALPKIEFPVIQVSARLAGASAETMAQSVALPLEQKFSSISGLETMTSTSAQGLTVITLQFSLETSLNTAALDVNAAIASSQSLLPENMTALPTFKKVNPAEQPIIFIALSSDTLPVWQINKYSDNLLVTRLSMLQDVAEVETIGAQKYAVRIYVKPELLKTRGIGLDMIANNVAQANINTASGSIQGATEIYMINPSSVLKNAKDFGEILINNQTNLRLKDIANVKDDVDNLYTAAWYKGKPTIFLAIRKQPGSNAIDVADRVHEVLPQLRSQLPASIQMEVMVDRTETIRHSIQEVKITSILTIILVITVIFFFLRNTHATIIPSLSLPISIMITFMIMYFMGFSLNNLTLLAITLSIGFIIDDAIVVLENISLHMEKKEKPLQAALKGSQEIGFTVLSMTLSLTAVFIPVIFMPGIVGRLFYEFAMTITIAIMTSGFVSLTLIPMLSQYLPQQHTELTYAPLLGFKNFYNWMEMAYKKTLMYLFQYQKYIVKFILVILILNVALYVFIPKGFFPNEDTGLIYGVSETRPEASFDAIKNVESKLLKVIENHPEINSYMASIGQSSTTIAPNEGRFFITLKPKGKRQNIDSIMRGLQKDFDKIPEIKTSMQSIQNLRIGATLTKSQYQYTLLSQDFKGLAKAVSQMESKLSKISGFLDINSDLKLENLQASIEIDRAAATRLGLSVKSITDALGFAYTDQQISSIYDATDIYPVIINFEQSKSRNLSDLSLLQISGKNGQLVPLSSFTKIKRTNAPLTINHFNRMSSATISFNLNPGMSLSQAVRAIKKAENEILLPPTIHTTYQGTAQAFQQSQGSQSLLLIAAIFTVYIILGVLYESFRHPITILTGLPSAGLGALIFLWVLGFGLDVIGIIGIVLLIGIVKKNAIMMIDYALARQREDGMPAENAIIEACHRRFRPIMMTTFAAILGALPIVLWSGDGQELRKPLGVCIVGGLLVSQWLTLYITPLFYVWIDNFRWKNKFANN